MHNWECFAMRFCVLESNQHSLICCSLPFANDYPLGFSNLSQTSDIKMHYLEQWNYEIANIVENSLGHQF